MADNPPPVTENKQRSPAESDRHSHQRRYNASTRSLRDTGVGNRSLLDAQNSMHHEDVEAQSASTHHQQVDIDLPNLTAAEVPADNERHTLPKKKKKKKKGKSKKKKKEALNWNSSNTMMLSHVDDEASHEDNNEETLQLALRGSMRSNSSKNLKLAPANDVFGEDFVLHHKRMAHNHTLDGNKKQENEKYRAKMTSGLLLQEERVYDEEMVLQKEETLQLQHTIDDATASNEQQQASASSTLQLVEPLDANTGEANTAAANLAMAQRFVRQQTVTVVGRRRNTPFHQEYDAEGATGFIGQETIHHGQTSDFSAHVSADLVGDTAPVTEEELRARILRESTRAEVVQLGPKQDQSSNCKHYVSKYWWVLIMLCLVGVGAIVVTMIFVPGADGMSPTAIPARGIFITASPSLAPSSQPSTSEPSLQPSTSEMQLRFEFFNKLLRPVSGDTLDILESPQSQALQWLALQEDCILCVTNTTNGMFLKERYVLAVLYFATNGSHWSDDVGFLSPNHHCTWGVEVRSKSFGVECTDDIVSSVVLPSNNLEGVLPPELGSLSGLVLLDLFSNQLYGTIPSSLAELVRLSMVFLDANRFSGTIPSRFFEMKSLRDLWLRGNILTGRLPENIGSATALTALTIAVNFLTGTIPAGISNLKQLIGANLVDNIFVGQLPSFAENSALRELYLGNSQFSGSIPTTIGNCKNLELFQLYDMPLTGTIPTEIVSLPMLAKVQISSVGITGTVPIFASKNMDFIILRNNRVSGGLDEFFAQTPSSLGSFDFEGNLLVGTIPETIGIFTSLTQLSLSNNSLTGTIETEFGFLTSLSALHLTGNQLIGTIPTELGQLSSMVELDMSKNQLEGQLPSELGHMGSLQKLAVFGNGLTGTIPTSIAELEILQNLQVYNNSFNGTLSYFCNKTEVSFIAADCSKVICECCTFCCNNEASCQPATHM